MHAAVSVIEIPTNRRRKKYSECSQNNNNTICTKTRDAITNAFFSDVRHQMDSGRKSTDRMIAETQWFRFRRIRFIVAIGHLRRSEPESKSRGKHTVHHNLRLLKLGITASLFSLTLWEAYLKPNLFCNTMKGQHGTGFFSRNHSNCSRG